MNKTDKQHMIESYNKTLSEHGATTEGLQWDNQDALSDRYKIFGQMLQTRGTVPTVLDVGCGFGMFYGVMARMGLKTDYTGYDINKRAIRIARDKYPAATFRAQDIETDEIMAPESFENVIAIGVFNNKMSDNMTWIKGMLRKMYELADICVLADFKSTHFSAKTGGAFYCEPCDLIPWVMDELSKRVVFRHDYASHEFMLCIFKPERR
jgi:SAM-dependent methyltransferase